MRFRPSTGLAVLLGVTGSAHFLKPEWFDAIVPRALPGPARVYTVVSGLVELVLATALLRGSTRRVAGYAAAVFFVAVFPANVQAALDGETVAWARLPLQAPLVWLAWQIGGGRRT
jgi:uncharacterized membrane protein